jgi:enoyl-CoA hydratase
VSVLVVRSAVDGVFSAGADMKEPPAGPGTAERRSELTRRVLGAVEHAPFPVVAAVDGVALGAACALVAAADIRIGTSRARFGLPEINVGRCGGARHVMRHLPQGVVRWMYFSGDQLAAEHAVCLGFLAWLADDLDGEVGEFAGRVAAKSPVALRLAKQSLNLVERMDIDTGYEVEQQFSFRLAAHPDAAEGAAAFREKRSPRWLSELDADPGEGGPPR